MTCRVDTSSRPGLDALAGELRRMAREEALAALREALQDLPGSRPRFTSLARHARTSGVGASTLRRWARAAGVRVQTCGKYLAAELDAAIASAGAPPNPVTDLARARAQRVARALQSRRP